jgi:hypothetical protein
MEWKIITGKLNHWALPLSTKKKRKQKSVKPYPTIKPHLLQQQTRHLKFPAIFRTANGGKATSVSKNASKLLLINGMNFINLPNMLFRAL